MRQCDNCGSRMPPFMPRTRLEDGSLVCKGCAQRNDTPAIKGAARKTAGSWFESSYGDEGAEGYEEEGVGEGRIYPIYDEDSHIHRPSTWELKWAWEAFTYDGLPERHSGVAQSPAEARAKVEEVINGGQMSLFGRKRKTAKADNFRVTVLDKGEQVPITVWSGHDAKEAMEKAIAESEDAGTVAVRIEAQRGGQGPYEAIWRDEGKTRMAARKVVAHDSGDGETIYHCPFCGAGQVTARSDGTAECGFCQTSFTVQVQPSRAAVPQTIDGVPHVHPDMPGTEPGTVPVEQDPEAEAVETDLTQQEQDDTNSIFASRTAAGPWPYMPGAPSAGHVTSGGWWHPGPIEGCPKCETKQSSRYFLTAEGVALPEESYLRHLAIRHAEDRQAVIAAVRAERQHRG